MLSNKCLVFSFLLIFSNIINSMTNQELQKLQTNIAHGNEEQVKTALEKGQLNLETLMALKKYANHYAKLYTSHDGVDHNFTSNFKSIIESIDCKIKSLSSSK